MDIKKKCSSEKHKDNIAKLYCQECKIYMCNKCENHHSELFPNHHQYNVDKDLNEIFTGLCKEENHFLQLDYFCKNHNLLCCAACLSKIKTKGNGQHTDCDVCDIKDIINEKKDKLKENIKYLEDLSKSLQDSINELKKIFEKINENKEELKMKIQKVFTNIRNALNDREDKLLLEVDNKFNTSYFKEDLIKENEKLPNKIKISLEKGKKTDNEWNNDNNNNLNLFINNCLDIEQNIKYIKEINENLLKFKYNDKKFIFSPEEENNNVINLIKEFGNILDNNTNKFKFKFKKCPNNMNQDRLFTVTGEGENILTKTGNDRICMGSICESQLEKDNEYTWKIKILKSTKCCNVFVGVSTIDFDFYSSSWETNKNCGWYFYCHDSTLCSGPPHNYNMKKTNLKKVKDEIIVIMNMKKRTLKFIIDNEDKGDSYTDIPIDKPIVPSVLLYDKNDSIEIIEC